ncbi:hypothetical protein MASR1M60_03970 [Rhodocyclaceae bacterium]
MNIKRRSLRHDVMLFSGGVLLVAAVIATLLAVIAYQTVYDRSVRVRSTAVVNDFTEKLQNIQREWDENLLREKTRLEFSRLLEAPEGRWDRLRAYLAALSDSPQFSGLAICDDKGRMLFMQGPPTVCEEPSLQKDHAHYIEDAAGNLYIELHAPIWLGPDGMGTMHLATPLDHAFLWRNAFPDVAIFLEWRGRIVASSDGEAGIERGRPNFTGRLDLVGQRFEQRRIALPARQEQAPHLLIQIRAIPPFSALEAGVLGLGVFAVIAALLMAMLHRWLARLLPRIESLSQAAGLYAQEGRPSEALTRLLQRVAGGDNDELSDVAVATINMVAVLNMRDHERQQTLEKLQLAEKVFENSAQAILITDTSARIVSVNPAFTEITGYTAAEAIGENPQKFASGRHDAAFYAAMWGSLRQHGIWAGEVWDRRKNGMVFPKWLTINAVEDAESGQISHYVGIFSDITEQKENAARIEHLAYHDPLTGLPNRFALNAHLAQCLSDARRNGTQLALMFLDLDRFKSVNDSLGHDVGDQLLISVAQRIRGALRESDTVARLGGDEFVVIVPGIVGPEDTARVAEKIVAEVGEPLVLAGHSLHTSPSIGIGMFPADGASVETLMKNADAAMYYAKQRGRNGFRFFTVNMNATASERLLFETQLHHAVNRHEFFLVFQPQVDIVSGRVVGVEALVRWRHPDHGEILPERFIAIAEEIGLIVPLGAWVLEEACRQAMCWGPAAETLRVAVNVSVHQLEERRFAEHVAATLARTGLSPQRLELEITESAVMRHPEAAVEMLRSLAALGVRLAIDDFGTGYSSLAYLKRLPNSRLKIDRSFVMDLETDPNDVAITEGIIALARSMGLAVTAEGVETTAQLDMLRRFGCLEGQGYLFSRPLSVEGLRAFLLGASGVGAEAGVSVDKPERLH